MTALTSKEVRALRTVAERTARQLGTHPTTNSPSEGQVDLQTLGRLQAAGLVHATLNRGLMFWATTTGVDLLTEHPTWSTP